MENKTDGTAERTEIRKGRTCLIAMPLVPLPLLFLPMDFATSILWLFAFGTYLYAIVKLTGMIVNILRGRARVSAWLLSPVLCIVLLPAVPELHGISTRRADEFAPRTAETVQAACNSAASCPDEIAGLDCGAQQGACNARAGACGTSYPVLYRREKDRKSFRIAVRHNIDSYFVITGGRGKELQTGRVVD